MKRTFESPIQVIEYLNKLFNASLTGSSKYFDRDNREVMRMLRFDLPDGQKEFRPIHPISTGWVIGDPPGTLPLYNINNMNGAHEIYVCEGEKCVEAAKAIGLIAVTSAHGSKAPHKTDWTPLVGRDVVILPDQDEAGEKYARAVCKILHALNPPARVKIVKLRLALGEDIVDYIENSECETNEDIQNSIKTLAEKTATEREAPKPSHDNSVVTASEDTKYPLTERGNGERFAAMHKDKAKYCHTSKRWLVHDGKRWNEESEAEISSLSKETGDNVIREALDAKNPDLRGRLLGHAEKMNTKYQTKVMLDFASTEKPLACYTRHFDQGLYLLNCANGTLDLKTGELQGHNPDDMIQRICPVEYDPDATLPMWEKFLHDATGGDPDLSEFLQVAVGYSLTGCTDEGKLFFIHGPTATCKTTCISAVKNTLGDYAKTADFESFLLQRNSSGPRNDIAGWTGSRIVIGSEVDDGRKLAAGLVKILTGGDTISVRRLYQEGFEDKPTYKLWLSANHRPKVKDDDSAIWRRILELPFVHTIPEKDRDPQVKKDLSNPDIAGPAILAWAVRGCLKWQEKGLDHFIPDVVKAATAEYQSEMDPLKDFYEDCCTFGPSCIVPVKAMWERYDQWCDDNGFKHTLPPRGFNERLKNRECEKKTTWQNGTAVKCWHGVGLKIETKPNQT